MNDKRRSDLINGILNYSSLLIFLILATVVFIYLMITYHLIWTGFAIIGICLIYKNIIKITHLKKKLK